MILRETHNFFSSKGQIYLASLYRALFSTAYFGLFRVGELTKGEHPVLARDIHISTNKRKILFILRTSKTHGKGSKPQQIKISSKKQGIHNAKVTTNIRSLPCPYQILREYLALRGPYRDVAETFFIFSDGSAVTLQHMRLCLKTVLHRLGFDESL